MSVEQYCTLSALKIVVAKFHLAEFERLAQAGSRFSLTIDPEYAYAPLHGHADGAVFEAFAAFDAFSCAIAHKLNFKRADRFSMTKIANDLKFDMPMVIRRRAADTVGTDRWKRLETLRNTAGHRSVVSQHMVWGTHLPGGFQVFLADDADSSRRGDEFLPVMEGLLGWSEGRLRVLFNGVCDRAFTRRGRILQLRGSEVKVDSRLVDG